MSMRFRLQVVLITMLGFACGADAAETFKDCADCPVMVRLAPGTFTMGSSEAETRREGAKDEAVADERPQRAITIKQAFALAQSAVTRGEFAAFVRESGHDPRGCVVYAGGTWSFNPERSWRNPGYAQTDQHPVVCVSFEDAQRYVQWLSRKSGQTYRLPSEAEWEYAARAGTATARFWSDARERACDFANVGDVTAAEAFKWNKGNAEQVFQCSDGHAHTAPVGSFRANAFGLNDMLGNVFQWTDDCYHPNYDGAPSDGSARTASECKFRVLRGGSWVNNPWVVRAAIRFKSAPDSRYDSGGFRVSRTR